MLETITIENFMGKEATVKTETNDPEYQAVMESGAMQVFFDKIEVEDDAIYFWEDDHVVQHMYLPDGVIEDVIELLNKDVATTVEVEE